MKKVPVIIVTLLILGLGLFGISQYNKVGQLETTVKNSEKDKEYLATSLEEEKDKNFQLEIDKGILIDSIATLNSKIRTLEVTIAKQRKEISSLRRRLARRDTKIQEITDEIAKLYSQANIDRAKIAELESKKTRTENDAAQVQTEIEDMLVVKGENDKLAADHERSMRMMQETMSIVDNTVVVFDEVKPSKFKNGRRISGMKKGSSAWKHTRIKFNLVHDDHLLLKNKEFVVKIIDTESNRLLTYLEEDELDDNRRLNGMKFTFDGNSFHKTYTNYQAKQSTNYEIVIFYVDENGDHNPLEKGRLPLVKNGKFQKL